MIFKTERLLVRELRESDLPGFHEMQGNPNVMKYVGQSAMGPEENRADLKRVIDLYGKQNNDFWVWAITTEKDVFVGTGAIIINEKNEWEIGYRFLESHWGNGYGTEITKGLIEHAFNSMNIKTLKAYVDRDNIGSVKILERFFDFEKEIWNEDDQCFDRVYKLSN